MISDVDEVCTIESIKSAVESYKDEMIAVGSNQEMFWYSFKQREVNIWSGSVLTKSKFALEFSPEFFRVRRWSLPKLLKGYHMTYFMNLENIKHKIENFAHQELNKEEFTKLQNIKERIERGLEPFERSNVKLISVEPSDIDSNIYEIFKNVNTA